MTKHRGIENILDIQGAISHLGVNESLFKDILAAAMKEIPQRTLDLENALNNDELAQVIFHAHTLKNITGTIGADTLTNLCVAMESTVKANAPGACDEAKSLFKKFKAGVEEIKHFLNS